jgi:Flp pilus assembly pilin Flp
MLEIVRYLSIKARAALYELRGDQRGLETIEIVLIAALVIVGSIFLWKAIGGGVTDRLTELCKGIMSDETQTKCNKTP